MLFSSSQGSNCRGLPLLKRLPCDVYWSQILGPRQALKAKWRAVWCVAKTIEHGSGLYVPSSVEQRAGTKTVLATLHVHPFGAPPFRWPLNQGVNKTWVKGVQRRATALDRRATATSSGSGKSPWKSLCELWHESISPGDLDLGSMFSGL